MSDTGFIARELLGMNYDEDSTGKKINVGTGGIRDSGKTKEGIELLDGPLPHKYIKWPRGSRKSSIVVAYIVRQILRNPDIRVIFVSRTDEMALEKSLAIRAHMESEAVTELFGPQKGDKWEETTWTVAGRSTVQMNATFRAFSQDSMPTGGRAHIVVVDDFIDHTNVTNAEQNRKSKERYALLQPFIAPGGIVVITCTTWADDDLNADLEASPVFMPPLGGQTICGAGVNVIVKEDGSYDLEVAEDGLTFPHLTLEHLRLKFFGMLSEGKYDHFVRQYLNETGSGDAGAFKRSHFQHLGWGEDMQKLSGYLVTDTATSEEIDACYSAIAYLGIDELDNIYLLDAQVGQWDEATFTDKFFDMLEEWQPKVNHCGECWENVALSTSYRGHIEQDQRARRLKLKTIEMARSGNVKSKKDRINRYLPYMQKRMFFVVDTVPENYTDAEGKKLLWDRTGHWDGRDKKYLPAGYLVDSFMKKSAKKDLPDAMAMLLEWQKIGKGRYRRYCKYKTYVPKRKPVSLTQERRQVYHAKEYGRPDSREWWDRTFEGF